MPVPRRPAWKRYSYGPLRSHLCTAKSDEQIYEDAEAKYAAVAKSINAVIDEAQAVLYKGSKAVSGGIPVEDDGTLFAVNNIPDYPRQEVVAVSCDAHPSVRSCSAQIRKDGDIGYVLVEAGKKGGGDVVGKTKGLFADVAPVSGKWCS